MTPKEKCAALERENSILRLRIAELEQALTGARTADPAPPMPEPLPEPAVSDEEMAEILSQFESL